MKFSIEKQTLLKHLGVVSKALSSKSDREYLLGVKIEVETDRIVLTASDNALTTVIRSEIPSVNAEGVKLAKIEETGSYVVVGKQFVDYIKKLKDGIINLTLTNAGINLKSGRSKMTIKGFDAAQYPDICQDDCTLEFSMDAMDLQRAIRATVLFCSTDDNRPILTGVHLKAKDSILTWYGTDSFHLSKTVTTLMGSITKEEHCVTIPSKPLLETYKILYAHAHSEVVNVKISKSWIMLYTNGYMVLTRLLDGAYPAVEEFIDLEGSTDVVINVKEMSESLDRVDSLSSSGKLSIVELTLEEGSNELELRNVSDLGDVSEVIELSEPSPITFVTRFNPTLLKNSLRTYEANELVFSFLGEFRPYGIRKSDYDNGIRLVVPCS